MPTLYGMPSTAAMAPHILLREIGRPFDLVLLDRGKGEHKSAAYLALNPHGRVPTLVDGDLVLYEAAAICLHLADLYPEAKLAPAVVPGTGSGGRGPPRPRRICLHAARADRPDRDL